MSLGGIRSLGSVVAWRVAHAAPRGYLLAAGVYLVADLALSAAVRSWVVLAVVVATMVLMLGHLAHEWMAWCGICAAMTPRDGAAAAHQYRRELRCHHLSALPIVLIALVVSPVAATDVSELGWRLVLDAATVLTAAMLYVDLVHRILRPWCPRCGWRRGGGGHGGEPDPDPGPQPGRAPVSLARDLPAPGLLAEGPSPGQRLALEWR